MLEKKQSSAQNSPFPPLSVAATSLILLTVAAILSLALFSYNPADPAWRHNGTEIPTNSLGMLGAWYSDLSFSLIGKLSYLLPLALLAICVNAWLEKRLDKELLSWRLIMLFSAILSGCVLWAKHDPAVINTVAQTGGGALGAWLTIGLEKSIKSVSVIMAFSAIIFTISISLLFSIPWLKFADWIGNGIVALFIQLFGGRGKQKAKRPVKAVPENTALQEKIKHLNEVAEQRQHEKILDEAAASEAPPRPHFTIDRYEPENETDELPAPRFMANTEKKQPEPQVTARPEPQPEIPPAAPEVSPQSASVSPTVSKPQPAPQAEPSTPQPLSQSTPKTAIKAEPSFFDFDRITPSNDKPESTPVPPSASATHFSAGKTAAIGAAISGAAAVQHALANDTPTQPTAAQPAETETAPQTAAEPSLSPTASTSASPLPQTAANPSLADTFAVGGAKSLLEDTSEQTPQQPEVQTEPQLTSSIEPSESLKRALSAPKPAVSAVQPSPELTAPVSIPEAKPRPLDLGSFRKNTPAPLSETTAETAVAPEIVSQPIAQPEPQAKATPPTVETPAENNAENNSEPTPPRPETLTEVQPTAAMQTPAEISAINIPEATQSPQSAPQPIADETADAPAESPAPMAAVAADTHVTEAAGSTATVQTTMPQTSATIGKAYESTSADTVADTDIDRPYELPSIQLLDTPPPQTNAYTEDVLAEMAGVLEATLKQFNIKAIVMHVSPGPVITRFELELAPGIQAKKITNLSQDLARALAVSRVRVEEVIPGSSYVGLEVPNKQRQIVYFKDVVRSKAFQDSASPLTISLGSDTSGKPVVADLMKMPHALVAGTTGSGKSVCINVMLLSMLYKASPKDLRLIMVDPKMLEMSMYEDIPHLLTPVITDMNEAENALTWAVGEMERRYQLMAALKVRKIDAFNEHVDEANARGEPIKDPLWNPDESVGYTHHPDLERLPFIVIVIDELADMMMVVGKQVEQLIARLTQKARAAGIHVVLATQRPSTDVLTGLIKANVPTRIAFQVSSGTDSRVIIDGVGAEKLLGHGDMLYVPPGASHPQRLHGAFVGDAETDRITDYLRSTGEPDYINGITGKQDPETLGAFGAAEAAEAKEDADPLYEEAVQIVLQTGKASISSVQRQLRIGYNRAARMIEDMQEQGIVSEPVNGIRKVLGAPPPNRNV